MLLNAYVLCLLFSEQLTVCVFTAQFQAWRLQNVSMLLKQFTLKDADVTAATCAVWNVYYVMRLRAAQALVRYIIGRGRVRSLLCASCGSVLWRRAIDKTNDGAEWRISARSVSVLSLDRDRSDPLRSVPVQSQYQDRCVLCCSEKVKSITVCTL